MLSVCLSLNWQSKKFDSVSRSKLKEKLETAEEPNALLHLRRSTAAFIQPLQHEIATEMENT